MQQDLENVCCHSQKKPKALLEINNKSLLENHIDTLIRLGFNNIVVNAFHLSEQIVEKIKKYDSRVNIIVENEILETGGGLLNAIKKNASTKTLDSSK